MQIFYVFKEIAGELFTQAQKWVRARPVFARLTIVAAICTGFLVVAKLLMALVTADPAADPFTYRRASGRLAYEDGSCLPAQAMLTFIPTISVAENQKVYPRPGSAVVDRQTGQFSEVTTRSPGDGIVTGSHAVVVSLVGFDGKPDDILPRDYMSPDTTPLQVDANDGYFDLKIKKPLSPAGRK